MIGRGIFSRLRRFLPALRSPPSLRSLTIAEIRALSITSPYYANREEYLTVAARIADELIGRRRLSNALELGPRERPLMIAADLMDRRFSGPLAREGVRCIEHDAKEIPWPVADDRYELFVALQVFEHLGTRQREVFREVVRVARHAIISLPIDWPSPPGDPHHGITHEIALDWFHPFRPTRVELGNGGPLKRLIYVFEDLGASSRPSLHPERSRIRRALSFSRNTRGDRRDSLSVAQPSPLVERKLSMNIYCGMQVRNEARMLPGALRHLRGYVDGFVALDDASTDQTNAILRAEPKMVALLENPPRPDAEHRWDEPSNRQRVLRALKDAGADWVLLCDADVRYMRTFLRMLKILARRAEHLAFYRFVQRELWDAPDTYRVDGAWGRGSRTNFFEMPATLTFTQHRPLHAPWAPDEVLKGPGLKVQYAAYNLGSLRGEDREQRRALYRSIDPNEECFAPGYDSLVDTRGLELARITEHEEYDYTSLPPDLLMLLPPGHPSRPSGKP